MQVMGIWPKFADGTDINAVDVLKSKQLVILYEYIYIYLHTTLFLYMYVDIRKF